MDDASEEQAHRDRLRAAATRWLSPVGGRTAAALVEGLAEVETDVYGDGGVVAELEEEVAAVLGTEAALLPSWDDLRDLVQAARDRGASVHCDGARLWEGEPAYGRDAAEIAGLFDTTYASLYKGLGGIGGACLAGDESFLARAAEWRHRLGGQAYGLWPYAAAGLRGLREHRRAMADRLAHLRAVVAEAEGVWAWEQPSPTPRPAWLKVELHASANLQVFTPAGVRDVVARLAGS